MARKYQKIWQALKDSAQNQCTIQVHRLITSRVVKAVIKEKHMDLVFKMANEKNPFRLITDIKELADKRHVRIEFRLVSRGLADIQKEVDL